MKIICSQNGLLAGLAMVFIGFSASSQPQNGKIALPGHDKGSYDMQTNNSEEIIGRWEAMQTTGGGLGSILEFRRDGSLNVSFGSLLHGTYKLEGGRLVEKTFQPDGSQTTEIREVVIQGDTLIMEADDVAKGHKISLVRLTPRDIDSSPIVGKWGQKAPIQFYEFKADGSLVFSGDLSNIPFMLTDATYKLDRHYLSISGLASNSKERVEQSYEIIFEGDTLIQKDRNGLEHRMRRVSQNNPNRSSERGQKSIVWHSVILPSLQ